MKSGTISVIVPIYNVEPYLHKCVDSILTQTYTKLEIILVDDGSPDNCGAICDEYAQKDKRIKVIHKSNGGLSDARNAGLDLATGDYIGFVDSDDYIEPDMYELMLNAIIRTESDMAICGYTDIYEEDADNRTKHEFNHERIYTPNEAIKHLLLMDTVNTAVWNKLYKRRLFGNIRFPEGRLYEDMIVVCKTLALCDRIVHTGRAKYNYLLRSNSISRAHFFNKTFDIFYQGESVWRFVRDTYSNLNAESDYFLQRQLWHLLGYINHADHIDKSSKEKMDGILREWAWRLNACKLLTVRNRLSFLKRSMIYFIHRRRCPFEN